jgi:hypothetical protein
MPLSFFGRCRTAEPQRAAEPSAPAVAPQLSHLPPAGRDDDSFARAQPAYENEDAPQTGPPLFPLLPEEELLAPELRAVRLQGFGNHGCVGLVLPLDVRAPQLTRVR